MSIKITVAALCFVALTLSTVGCSKSAQLGTTKTVISRQTVNELEKERVPGTHNDAFVETMHSTVRVPGSIDPSGVYYRLGHQMVYEIRPGKYQKVQYPNRDGNYRRP